MINSSDSYFYLDLSYQYKKELLQKLGRTGRSEKINSIMNEIGKAGIPIQRKHKNRVSAEAELKKAEELFKNLEVVEGCDLSF